MRVLFTDAADSTQICAFVQEVRYDDESCEMYLYCTESDFCAEHVTPSEYRSYLFKLLTYGYLDLSGLVFDEVA